MDESNEGEPTGIVPLDSGSDGTQVTSQPVPKPPERNAKGHFAKGNTTGKLGGRKPIATERQYLTTLASEVTQSDWAKIAKRAVSDAKAGDSKAREWLSKYLLPAERSAGVTLLDIAIAEINGLTAEDYIRDQSIYSAPTLKRHGAVAALFGRWISLEEQRINRGLYGGEVKERKQVQLDVLRLYLERQNSAIQDMRTDEDPEIQGLVAEAVRELEGDDRD